MTQDMLVLVFFLSCSLDMSCFTGAEQGFYNHQKLTASAAIFDWLLFNLFIDHLLIFQKKKQANNELQKTQPRMHCILIIWIFCSSLLLLFVHFFYHLLFRHYHHLIARHLKFKINGVEHEPNNQLILAEKIKRFAERWQFCGDRRCFQVLGPL